MSPALMMGVIRSLGEAAQGKVKGASALLAGISGFMAAVGTESVDYVMSDEERARVVADVEKMANDSDELPGAPASALESAITLPSAQGPELEPAPTPPPVEKTKTRRLDVTLSPRHGLGGFDEFRPF